MRLLNFEEKLFKRLAKRLLASDSAINAPADTVDAPSATIQEEDLAGQTNKQRAQWKEDMVLDFAAYESNIIRVQFLFNSNERERERYAAEKIKILETAQAVRENNTQLHEQLKDAQRVLAVRKGYDALADKITNDRSLKPRDEQHAQLEKLDLEIAELEREGAEYSTTWAERREQFGKIVEEGMQMLRLIRDEKEEAERKEGMEDMDDVYEAGGFKVGTPRASGDPGTPLNLAQEETSGFQRTATHALGVTVISKQSSRAASAAPEQIEPNTQDAEMTEAEHSAPEPRIEDDSDIEEGEETELNNATEDKMEMT